MSAARTDRRRGHGAARWVGRIVPLGLLLAGLYLMNDARVFLKDAASAEGEVVSVNISTSRDSETGAISYSYRPNIQFTTADGRSRVSPTHISSSNYDYAVGTRLAVLYDPANPSDLRIDSFWSLWLLPGMFTIFGAMFLVLFGVLGVGTRKRRAGAGSAETAPELPPEAPEAPPDAPRSPPGYRKPRRENRYEDYPPTVRR